MINWCNQLEYPLNDNIKYVLASEKLTKDVSSVKTLNPRFREFWFAIIIDQRGFHDDFENIITNEYQSNKAKQIRWYLCRIKNASFFVHWQEIEHCVSYVNPSLLMTD